MAVNQALAPPAPGQSMPTVDHVRNICVQRLGQLEKMAAQLDAQMAMMNEHRSACLNEFGQLQSVLKTIHGVTQDEPRAEPMGYDTMPEMAFAGPLTPYGVGQATAYAEKY